MSQVVSRDLSHVRRIVVKIGSSSLTAPDGTLDEARVRALAGEVASARTRGVSAVIVTSGAIAAGLEPLAFKRRPSDIPSLQAAASVGQGALIHAYQRAFARRKIPVGQVLLTQHDFLHREAYVNAHQAMERLLGLGAVPVVNENDATGVAEIRFGDNDRLAALVAMMVRADLLIMLSDVDGVYSDDPRRAGATLLHEIADLATLRSIGGGKTGSTIGSGGMASKVESIVMAASAGIACVVASARAPRVVQRVLAGAEVGTHVPAQRSKTRQRKAWIAFAQTPRGTITVDAGARTALSGGKSLLPAGITGYGGGFVVGDVVEVCDLDGVFARGVTSYAADELADLVGKRLAPGAREVIHRDSLVLL